MLTKAKLGQILLDYREGPLPDLIERELKVDMEMPLKRAVTIMGPRRSGKTYYLYSLIERLLSQGVSKDRTLYVNFEGPEWVGADLEDLKQLIEVYFEIYPGNRQKRIWLFFDEIQNVENWERFVRGLLDTQNASIFLSGSSSKLLSKEIATSMRGRSFSYLLLPFSFREFLKIKGIPYKKYLSSQERARIANAMGEYFSYGGYPEAVIYSKEREKIIREIMEVTIYRDVLERHNIRNAKLVKLMFNYLVQAKEFSVHKFYQFLRTMQMKVSKNSLYQYLDFFNDAFIFFPLRKFSYSVKQKEQSIPKIYAVDNALISVLLGEDKGKLLENGVFLSLLRRGYEPNQNLFYYTTTQGEVDFLIKEKNKVTHLIQACYDSSHYLTKEREMKALSGAAKECQCRRLSIVTFDTESVSKYNGLEISLIPLWQWLLLEP